MHLFSFPSPHVRVVPFDQLDPVNDVAYWGESIRAVLNVLGQLRGGSVLLAKPLLLAEAESDLAHFDEELLPLTTSSANATRTSCSERKHFWRLANTSSPNCVQSVPWNYSTRQWHDIGRGR